MIVNSISAASAVAPAGSSDANKASLNYDAFLRLLIASMKNQDPTEPADPSQMLSQLASFSVVEQAIKTNDRLDMLMAHSLAGQAGSLIGKTITVPDGSSGVVRSVEIGESGLVATLDNGLRTSVGPGVTVSGP